MFKKIKKHFKKWNSWRKYNTNSWLHKILVLLKLRHSPTFENWYYIEDIRKGFYGEI